MNAKMLFSRALTLKNEEAKTKPHVPDFDHYVGRALKPYLSKADIKTLVEMARRYEYSAFADGLEHRKEASKDGT